MEHFNLRRIVKALNGTITKIPNDEWLDKQPSTVCIDSRECIENSIYIPYIGQNEDGHKYIEDAIKNGAKYILHSKTLDKHVDGVAYIHVEDTVWALKELARAYKEDKNVKIIAITGSVGKTTTKELVASVLGVRYRVCKTKGNLNSQTGVPLTLFQIKNDDEICVVEMGMDNFKEIEENSRICQPDTTCITNIGVSHLEILKTRENILKAKCEIFEYQKKGGLAVLNGDDELLSKVSLKDIRVKYAGKNRGDYIAKISSIDYEKDMMIIDINSNIQVSVKGVSSHMAYPASIAYAIAKEYHLDDEEIKVGFEKYLPQNMRFETVKLKGNRLVIFDGYNACPASMESAITTAMGYNKKVVAIVGDMLELGSISEQSHKEVGEYLANNHVYSAIFIGEKMKKGYDKYIQLSGINGAYYKDKEEIKELKIPEDSVTMIKASRGIKLETIFEEIKEKYGK